MAIDRMQVFCQRCQRQTLHTRQRDDVNHVMHLLITIFLCILWLPFWIAFTLLANASNTPFRCADCGHEVSPGDMEIGEIEIPGFTDQPDADPS